MIDWEKLQSEYSEPNWDAYGAEPINLKSLELAKEFCGLLGNLPEPELGCEPDGMVCLDWYRERGSGLSMSFHTNLVVVYMLDGEVDSFICEMEKDKVPDRIANIMKKIYGLL